LSLVTERGLLRDFQRNNFLGKGRVKKGAICKRKGRFQHRHGKKGEGITVMLGVDNTIPKRREEVWAQEQRNGAYYGGESNVTL